MSDSPAKTLPHITASQPLAIALTKSLGYLMPPSARILGLCSEIGLSCLNKST